ncbi:hypothetical protein [Cochleicola gelatinilyticus]|uniref:Uncharacterized protein n=1 Tax=Cochleicola gelatinilyticus TaxID=1763537 RepID=A0A167EQ43_9FLAO|nr:hypothetical protein [Cochleicola gelatinilyticus]OAB75764.1 hypothetical protein ULVI_14915 [Cochleicola gelatinilyticus]
MAQDIRKMLEQKEETSRLSEGHEARFEARLEKAFPSEKVNTLSHTSKENPLLLWMKIAAVAVVFIAVAAFGWYSLSGDSINETPAVAETASEKTSKKNMTLADISPDLKKVEDYYMTGINLQLASLKITDDTKDIIDGYMKQLAELDAEYEALNTELTEVGPSEATITALIDNLKLRLELLFKLKNKLKELKNQNNEQFETIET